MAGVAKEEQNANMLTLKARYRWTNNKKIKQYKQLIINIDVVDYQLTTGLKQTVNKLSRRYS